MRRSSARTEGDRPSLLNDLILVIDIHPNLPLISSAYMMDCPELIIPSEVVIIKGQSKSARPLGAHKEVTVSLEVSCASPFVPSILLPNSSAFLAPDIEWQ